MRAAQGKRPKGVSERRFKDTVAELVGEGILEDNGHATNSPQRGYRMVATASPEAASFLPDDMEDTPTDYISILTKAICRRRSDRISPDRHRSGRSGRCNCG